jgi:hypothetical protein
LKFSEALRLRYGKLRFASYPVANGIHQRRIPKALLEQAETRLQAVERKLTKAADFSALHQLVEGEIGSITGIGTLTVYDISHRIGAHFGKVPGLVYLHAGTRAGARVFNISGNSFNPAASPKAFARLAPSEIEDCLCIYKDKLRNGAWSRSSRHKSGCTVKVRQRRACL